MPEKRPKIDQEKCIGCGTCVSLCPAVFELKDGKAQVVHPDKCDECDCQVAVNSCPTGAISLVGE